MLTITKVKRKPDVLSSLSLACLAHILADNLTSGCAHDYLYCYARRYSIFPGDNKVVIYENTLNKLKDVLSYKKLKPQAVYFSPSRKRRIDDKNGLEALLDCYRNEKRLSVCAEHFFVTPLSLLKREEIYMSFKQLAKKYTLDLSICGCMNPDIGGTCKITGEWPTYDTQLRSLS